MSLSKPENILEWLERAEVNAHEIIHRGNESDADRQKRLAAAKEGSEIWHALQILESVKNVRDVLAKNDPHEAAWATVKVSSAIAATNWVEIEPLARLGLKAKYQNPMKAARSPRGGDWMNQVIEHLFEKIGFDESAKRMVRELEKFSRDAPFIASDVQAWATARFIWSKKESKNARRIGRTTFAKKVSEMRKQLKK